MAVSRTLLKDKKAIRNAIEQKLEETFSEFRGNMKEKKFKRSIKKASKLLANRFSRQTIVVKKGKNGSANNSFPEAAEIK